MKLDFVSLKGSAVSSSVCSGVYEAIWLWAVLLLMVRVVFLFCKWFGVKRPRTGGFGSLGGPGS